MLFRSVLDDTPRAVFSHVDEIKKIGLDVPQVTELAWELKKAGFDISSEIITEQECVEELLGIFNGTGN